LAALQRKEGEKVRGEWHAKKIAKTETPSKKQRQAFQWVTGITYYNPKVLSL
jgi:hypothetical protein